ncbi:MAG: hypothetical protein U0105_03570 [Candidatus Obscuribacterales bacterium]
MIFRSRLIALGVFATLLAPVVSFVAEQSCDARGGRGGGIKRGGSGLKRGGNFGGGRGLSRRGGRGGYRNQDLNGDGVVDQADKRQARGLTSSMGGGGGAGTSHVSGAGGNSGVGGQGGNGVTVYHPSPGPSPPGQ